MVVWRLRPRQHSRGARLLRAKNNKSTTRGRHDQTSGGAERNTDARMRCCGHAPQRVVPGGMWGHLNAARLPEGYPQFFASAEGCRVRDVDGREYIDFMCSWGPVLLGHRHPEVQAAAEAQAALGDCFNGPGRGHGRTGRGFRRHGAACGLGDVPEERRRCHHGLRDDCARRHRTAQDAGREGQLSRRAALVFAERRRRHQRGSRASAAFRI